jgi:hypothetical protein
MVVSARYKVNVQKYIDPHHLDSRGYIRKMLLWDTKVEAMEWQGITPHTIKCEPRSMQFFLARGGHAIYNPDRILVTLGNSNKLLQKVDTFNERLREWSFKSYKESYCSHKHSKIRSILVTQEGLKL